MYATTLDPRTRAAKRGAKSAISLLIPALLGILTCRPAQALDGCMVMLCLAAPSWREVPQCVPTIEELHRHLALGRRFPSCPDSGAGNDAGNEPSRPPEFCPPQYTHAVELENSTRWTCEFDGAITVRVDGTPWTRTWWDMLGRSVTDFSPAAKARLGTWSHQFDDDYAAWLAAQPPAIAPDLNP